MRVSCVSRGVVTTAPPPWRRGGGGTVPFDTLTDLAAVILIVPFSPQPYVCIKDQEVCLVVCPAMREKAMVSVVEQGHSEEEEEEEEEEEKEATTEYDLTDEGERLRPLQECLASVVQYEKLLESLVGQVQLHKEQADHAVQFWGNAKMALATEGMARKRDDILSQD